MGMLSAGVFARRLVQDGKTYFVFRSRTET